MAGLLLRTLREDPAEAEVPSHRLLVRAGYIRRAAPGGYTWLPLGRLLLDRVTQLVRDEMVAIGGQEVSFPALLPREIYETSGRAQEYGPDMFRLRDRRGGEHILAPTHEEMFTLLVKDVCGSYRDYPKILFQVQSKYRDEPRPRAGLLRGREFLMKDSYSFDLDDAGLAGSYAAHRAAYRRIFDALGLRYAIVSALSGPMGGNVSEEFLADLPVGEDTFARCPACGHAANVEALTTPPPAPIAAPTVPLTVLDTPATPTIESLVAVLNTRAVDGRTDWTAADTLKNVVLTVDDEITIIGVPGDREVDLKRLSAVLFPARVALFEDFAGHPELVRGYIGPQRIPAKIRYLVDPRVVTGSTWVTGANEPGRHASGVTCGRDFTPDGTIEAVQVREGDPCPECGAGLELRRGVEIGHIFQLGRRYADVFGLDAPGPDGKPVRVTMGSYGIGLSRLVAVLAEQYHDASGLCWPARVAPAQVHLVPLGAADGVELAGTLEERGLRVLLDDRPGLSAGVRFADAELLGAPYVIVLGRRLADGYVELRDRASGERREVPLTGVIELVATAAGV